jgi:beta-galactosidase
MYLQLDISRGTRQAPFLIAETNATSIGGSAENRPPYRGQLRQAVWAFIARGARMVEYWHWHTQHYGAEMYWGGILGHSLQPGRIYEELATVAGELRETNLEELAPVSDVAVLVSAASRWGMEFVGPLAGPAKAWMGDPQSYERILAAFYRGLFDAGLSVDVVAPAQLPRVEDMVERWPCSSCRVSTWRPTRCSNDCAATPRRAATSSSRRAPATPMRTRSRATWSCRALCARRPACPTWNTRT